MPHRVPTRPNPEAVEAAFGASGDAAAVGGASLGGTSMAESDVFTSTSVDETSKPAALEMSRSASPCGRWSCDMPRLRRPA